MACARDGARRGDEMLVTDECGSPNARRPRVVCPQSACRGRSVGGSAGDRRGRSFPIGSWCERGQWDGARRGSARLAAEPMSESIGDSSVWDDAPGERAAGVRGGSLSSSEAGWIVIRHHRGGAGQIGERATVCRFGAGALMADAVVIAASATGAVEPAISSAFMGSATCSPRGLDSGRSRSEANTHLRSFRPPRDACRPSFRIKVAELQPDFATLTEGMTFAAQASVRQMGIARRAPNLAGLWAAAPVRR